MEYLLLNSLDKVKRQLSLYMYIIVKCKKYYCRTREPTTVRGSHKCNESSDTENGRLRSFKGDSIILALLRLFWLDVATKLLMWHY